MKVDLTLAVTSLSRVLVHGPPPTTQLGVAKSAIAMERIKNLDLHF